MILLTHHQKSALRKELLATDGNNRLEKSRFYAILEREVRRAAQGAIWKLDYDYRQAHAAIERGLA